MTMDHAVALLSQYGQDALMAKIDLKAAFRLIPVQAADWVHLGICWRGQFYVDTCLPFGLRSAPALFNHYAEALDWIMTNNYGAQLLHYLDDFLLVGPPGKDTCQEAMSRMLTVCDQLGIPVASEKLEGPTTTLTFLGIVLDASAQQLRLPPDKLEELTGLTRSWLSRHKATKRELLSLIGKLSFAAKVVPAGTLFLRRLIDLSTTVRKLHHHISLNAEARADIKWWDCFLPSWNGVAMFLDPEWTAADSLQLYTDASGSLGFGAYFNGAWFQGDWQPHQRLSLRSIQWQELFAIVAAASTWGHLWAGLRIHFHCDNLPIVQAWARQSAKHPDLMRLLRTLFLVAAQHSFTIRLSHLPGRLNSIADALSRNKVPLFFTLAPQADPQPTPTPHHLPET